jgi:hypothetical protein
VKRLFVVIAFASAAPVLAQAPAARLGAPVPPHTVRAADPDAVPDDRPLPAARLGVITSARIGQGPTDATPEERYNWGAPRSRGDARVTPASRNRDRDDRNGDRDFELAGRGARLREPAEGRLTFGRRRGPLVEEGYGGDPAWWPGRERALEDLRGEFPAFGDQGGDRLAFQSDCAFDNMISPITNPFLAEDPRSLTELRPIFMYQTIPGDNPFYRDGSAVFFGGQARVAFTERFSVVLHKLGGLSINPGSGSLVSGESGFAEIWLGPKFAFWRNPDTQTIASAGLQFQLPFGSGSVFQNTGGLALVPYVTFGSPIGRTEFGTINVINVAGYHLGTSDRRSDYFFDTLHLNLDAGDFHRFYPVLELSWFHYTTNGTERPTFPFEGRDLANVGGSASGRDVLTLAPGFRYKFNENLQTGVGAEFPVVGGRDLLRFRLTIDLIWRY